MISCNYCKCKEYNLIADYTRVEKNNVLQCKKCGLVYLEMNKSKKEIESFYSLEYRKLSTKLLLTAEELFHHKLTQDDAKDRVKFILKHTDIRDKRVLEIGSASGNLLDELGVHAKEVIGIELNSEFAEYNQRFKVFTQPLEDLDLGKFDVIVSFHTLEHIYDPSLTMEAIFKALKPNGYFLGEVPNQNDWRIKLFNDEMVKLFHYDPNHYYYYSPETLQNYLNTSGFEDVSLETVERYNSFEQLKNILCRSPKRSVKETLNKYLFPDNENRLPSETESGFNKLFGRGINSELMGNCLRWAAH